MKSASSHSVKNQAQSVSDIFKIMGEADARSFINSHVHSIDIRWSPEHIEKFLLSQHHGLHKDLETYADVAVEKFNARN